jgi:uncharacterized protein YjbJ (UPF0337 family)
LNAMNWDQVEGKWKQFKGSVRDRWGKFSEDEIESIAGKRDVLIGKLQERYGYSKDEAQREVEEWHRAEFQHRRPSQRI